METITTNARVSKQYQHQKHIIKGDPILTRRVVIPEALLKEKEIETMTLVWSLSQVEFMEGETKESDLTNNE